MCLGVRVLSDLDVSIDSILLSMETFCKAKRSIVFLHFALRLNEVHNHLALLHAFRGV